MFFEFFDSKKIKDVNMKVKEGLFKPFILFYKYTFMIKLASENYRCPAHTAVIAAIDIGTNSCRLLVGSVNLARLRNNFFSRKGDIKGWKIIDSYAKVVKLGKGLFHSSLLSEQSIEKTLDALEICKKKIDRYNICGLRIVATEACRRAKNVDDLIQKAYEKFNFKIEVISGYEEGRLILTGCSGVLDPSIPYAIVFDIGGGSTELVWVKVNTYNTKKPGYPISFNVIDTISLPYGVVISTESNQDIKNCFEKHQKIRSAIKSDLEAFCKKNNIYSFLKQNLVQLLGSSGTVTTLAAFQAGLARYERRLVDGITLNISDLKQSSQQILNMSIEERILHPCIGKGRHELILAGSAILEGIFDIFNLDRVRIADRGIREGILSELLDHITKEQELMKCDVL